MHTDGRMSFGCLRDFNYSIRRAATHFGEQRLTELTRQDVEDWYLSMLKSGKSKPVTARKHVQMLKRMQDYAIRRKLMLKTPVSDALVDLRGIKKAKIRTFSKDEVGLLLDAASMRRQRARAYAGLLLECYVNIAAFCGLRFGEISGLTVKNIDFVRRIIHVRHSYCQHSRQLKDPKTKAGVRDVPMPRHVVALVRNWIDNHHQDNEMGLAFHRTLNLGKIDGINSENFHQNYWRPLLNRAGLADGDSFHFHALRHFAASWMIENHMPLTEVARVLGHAKFDMTLQVYAHPVNPADSLRDAFDSMADRLLIQPPTLTLTALPGPANAT
jgi:integrase